MYIPLYVKTNYSLLSSLITIDNYISYAKEKNYSSIAITDTNMYGVMEFYKKCINNDIKPIIGLELNINDNIIILYAKDYIGYKTLIKLCTLKEERKLKLDDILSIHDNVVGIIPLKYINLYNDLVNTIPDLYIGYSNKDEEKEALQYTKNIVFIRESLYVLEKNKEYLKYLYMIRDGKVETDEVDYEIDNHNLDINNIYDYTSNENLFNTNRISDMCNLEFPKFQNLLPIYTTPNNMGSFEYLKELASAGLNKRLDGKPTEKYVKRLEYELSVIEKMGFSNYFLIVYDFIKYAKKNNILVGPGRGSGAGSLVCYSLGITEIDPLKYNLIFERFLNPERISMPDIDTDFPDKDREEVIKYVIDKYGKKCVSGIITFGTLARRQVIRDVARVLKTPDYQVNELLKKIDELTIFFDKKEKKIKLSDLYNEKNFMEYIDSSKNLKKLYKIACVLEGFPRHTSIHAAGIIMSSKDIDEVVPLTISDDNMYLTQYPAEYLEEFGLLKMDFLAIKTLTLITNIINDINENEKTNISFNKIPLDSNDVFNLFSKGLTDGIFQFESNGMKKTLRKIQPSSLEDIFAAIALYRPGPDRSIDSYVRRKFGKEKIDYIDSALEPVLKSTYGILVYQEQIMQIAVILAGYSLGEADILRKAVSKKKQELIVSEEEKFTQRCIKNGYDDDIAKKVFSLIKPFAGYGFNRCHSVPYSIIAYKMMYLKSYYPKYFYANLLTSEIGNIKKTVDYIREARIAGIKVLKPDINKSSNKYNISSDGIYYPLTGIKVIGKETINRIIDNRGLGYTDIFDFLSKNKDIDRKVLESLIKTGVFDSFNINRKTLIEGIDELFNYQELAQDFSKDDLLKPELDSVEEYSNEELVNMEKELFGLYISNHPITNYKAKYDNIISLENLPNYFNKYVSCVCLVEKIKTIRTKNGDDMMFFDASDEYAKGEFTVFPKVYEENKELKVGDILKVDGKVERRYDVYQIIVNKIERLN